MAIEKLTTVDEAYSPKKYEDALCMQRFQKLIIK